MGITLGVGAWTFFGILTSEGRIAIQTILIQSVQNILIKSAQIIIIQDLFILFEIYINFFNELNSSIINKTDIKSLVKKLLSFISSEKFIPYLIAEANLEETMQLSGFIYLFETVGKYFSVKIYFNLLEEMMNEKFDDKIKEIYNQRKNNFNDLVKIHDLYLEQHEEDITNFWNQFNEENKDSNESKFLTSLSNYTEEKKEYIKQLWMLYANIFIFTYQNIFQDFLQSEMKKKENNNLLFHFFQCLKHCLPDKKQINGIINNLTELKSLTYTKNIQQTFLFLLNLIKNEKEIIVRDKIDNKFFENFGDLPKINDKLIFTIYEEDLKISKYNKKYIKTILEGKKTEKEYFNLDFFYKVGNDRINKTIKGIKEADYNSIFCPDKKILIIMIDFNYFKTKKITSEQFKEIINSIQENNNSELYAQIENKIFNLNSSYDSYIKELENRKVIVKALKNEEKERTFLYLIRIFLLLILLEIFLNNYDI